MATANAIPLKHTEDGSRKIAGPCGTLGDKAKLITDATVERIEDVADGVARTARDAVAAVDHQAERATHAVGSGLESMANTVRNRLPAGSATEAVAEGLESGGKYLRKETLQEMGEDVTNLIRRNPLPSILLGVALGYLIGWGTTRS